MRASASAENSSMQTDQDQEQHVARIAVLECTIVRGSTSRLPSSAIGLLLLLTAVFCEHKPAIKTLTFFALQNI